MSLFRWQGHQHFLFGKSHDFKTIAVCGFSPTLSGGNSTTAYKYSKNISYIQHTHTNVALKKSNFNTTKNKKTKKKKQEKGD